jgi:7,8-dihydropterin-6-yl-methyl-4-(beta-D-ribofuranosyl)aminobenzene 5'-phosphate synthase
MLIQTLVENTDETADLGCEHGLSYYIEVHDKKLLFDVGASSLFYENAKKLGIDIGAIDLLVISHGHNDHVGGLSCFLDLNRHAAVYIRDVAFTPLYARRAGGQLEEIGPEGQLRTHPQITLTGRSWQIGPGMTLFSDIETPLPRPQSNAGLLAESEGVIQADTFRHEQVLALEEDGRVVLFTGCAHNGVLNIVRHYETISGRSPDAVIGGFHLSSRTTGNESEENIRLLAAELMKNKTKYYTGHCTGLDPFEQLKAIMGEQITYLATGSRLRI